MLVLINSSAPSPNPRSLTKRKKKKKKMLKDPIYLNISKAELIFLSSVYILLCLL